MSESIKAFLNSIAYHVGDVPMLDVGEAQQTLDEWKEEGMPVPSDLDALTLYAYYQETLCERYPISTEPLTHELDRLVYQFLRGEGWDFQDGLDAEIDYIDAWFSVNDWISVKRRDGEQFPQYITPEVFMRYVNSHHARRDRCHLWIIETIEDKEGKTKSYWHGPFEHLDHIGIHVKDGTHTVFYRYDDCVKEGDEIEVDEWHSIVYRNADFYPPC